MTFRLYSLVIQMMILFLKIISIVNPKAKKTLAARSTPVNFPIKQNLRIWIHCASLGEYEQAKILIIKLREKITCEIALTFFSPSGYEYFTDHHLVDFVSYLPFDLKGKTNTFLDKLNPDVCIFIKYELWWQTIQNIYRRKIPFILVAAQFYPNHYLLKSWFSPFLQLLRQADQLFLADQSSYKVLKSRNFNNLTHAGETRAESILYGKVNKIKNQFLAAFTEGYSVIILGSTYEPEHEQITALLKRMPSKTKLLIFPHEMDQINLKKLCLSLANNGFLYSEFTHKDMDKEVCIIDRIGWLRAAYQYANKAYVGGGFGKGIHNILEPLVYKIPVFIGPEYHKFAEARKLVEMKAIRVIPELAMLPEALTDESWEPKPIKILEGYESVFSVQATDKIIDFVMQKLR